MSATPDNFETSCRSKIKLLQINIPSNVSGKHYSNDTEGWPKKIIKIWKFRVFHFFSLFYKYSFCSLFQQIKFLLLKLSVP